MRIRIASAVVILTLAGCTSLSTALAQEQVSPTATPSPTPATPDQRIELAAAAIVDESGASLVERIEWNPPPAANPSGAFPEMNLYFAPGPWHKAARSRKREVVDGLVALPWRESSWAEKHFADWNGMSVRLYVGATFLGRLRIDDSLVSGRDDRFQPARAWADQ